MRLFLRPQPCLCADSHPVGSSSLDFLRLSFCPLPPASLPDSQQPKHSHLLCPRAALVPGTLAEGPLAVSRLTRSRVSWCNSWPCPRVSLSLWQEPLPAALPWPFPHGGLAQLLPLDPVQGSPPQPSLAPCQLMLMEAWQQSVPLPSLVHLSLSSLCICAALGSLTQAAPGPRGPLALTALSIPVSCKCGISLSGATQHGGHWLLET